MYADPLVDTTTPHCLKKSKSKSVPSPEKHDERKNKNGTSTGIRVRATIAGDTLSIAEHALRVGQGSGTLFMPRDLLETERVVVRYLFLG